MSFRNQAGIVEIQLATSVQRLPFFQGTNLIGRNPNKTNIHIQDRSISEIHAKLICRDKKIFILDNNSKNGVYLNGVDNQIEKAKEIQIDCAKDVIYFSNIKCQVVPSWSSDKSDENTTGMQKSVSFAGQQKRDKQFTSIIQDQKQAKKALAISNQLEKQQKQTKVKSEQKDEEEDETRVEQKKKKRKYIKKQTKTKQVKEQQRNNISKPKDEDEVIVKKGESKPKKNKKSSKEKSKEKQKEKPKDNKKERSPIEQKKNRDSANTKKQGRGKETSETKNKKTKKNKSTDKRTESEETLIKKKKQRKAKSLERNTEGFNKGNLQARKRMANPDHLFPYPRRTLEQKYALLSNSHLTFIPSVRIHLIKDVSEHFDVLVMQKYLRTYKLLYAVMKGVPIVSSSWILESEYKRKIMPINKYLLDGPEKDCLSSSIDKVCSGNQVFFGLHFFLISDHYHLSIVQIQDLIRLGKGNIIEDESKVKKSTIIIVRNDYSHDDLMKLKCMPHNQKIYTVEMVLDSCLRQEIDWDANEVVKIK